ncbi:MAG: hypothetical protein SFX73_36005 [Kofleriaceae bacterium]|nr:hypothetical protein [Kofleriaceae bacterium]
MTSAASLALASLLTAGCHVVFGADAPSADAPTSAVDSAFPDGCQPTTFEVPASADTFLLAEASSCMGNPSPARYGAFSNINIGMVAMQSLPPSRGLFRFTLSDDLGARLRNGVAPRAARLTLRTQDEPVAAANLHAYLIRSDWTEGSNSAYDGASWCVRQSTTMSMYTDWEEPGADGDRDPSLLASVSLASLPSRSEFSLEDSPSALQRIPDAYNVADRALSLIVILDTGSPVSVLSREGAAAEGGTPPTLSLTFCE